MKINRIEINVLSDLELLDKQMPQYESLHLWLQQILSPDFRGISISTSGSTGNPKTIALSKNHLDKSARRTGDFFEFESRQKVLLPISLNRIGGFMMLYRAFLYNQNLEIVRPAANAFAEIEAGESFYFSALVPLQLNYLVEHRPDLLKNFKYLLIGGAAVSVAMLSGLLSKNHTRIYHSYGMTETASHVALRRLNPKPEMGFYALKGVELNLNLRGELLIRDSYCESAELQTTDLVGFNADGSFELLGRSDEIINSGGIKINIALLEKTLQANILALSKNASIALLAVSDDKLGEKLIMFYFNCSLDLLQKMLAAHPNKYERPREVLELKEMPLLESQKIDRQKLRRIYNNLK